VHRQVGLLITLDTRGRTATGPSTDCLPIAVNTLRPLMITSRAVARLTDTSFIAAA